jgi:hypothetical protein
MEPSAPVSSADSAADVQSILAKTRERYRNAKTYADEGTLRVVFEPGTDRERVTTGRFRTRWAAPDRLSFDLRIDPTKFSEAERLAVWTPRGGGTKTFFLDKIENAESLDSALSALQGVTNGLTGLVPRWLGQGCRCSGTYEARGIVACGPATCIELAATLRPNDRVTLSIDTATGALRKYSSVTLITPTPMPEELLVRLSPAAREAEQKRSLEPFEVQQTVDFDPKFDERIDEAAFTVDPSTPAPTAAPLGK